MKLGNIGNPRNEHGGEHLLLHGMIHDCAFLWEQGFRVGDDNLVKMS
jgi:hypothetical protein